MLCNNSSLYTINQYPPGSTGARSSRSSQLLEVWDEKTNIVYPPDFTSSTDGAITTSGLVQLYKQRVLTSVSSNIFQLSSSPSSLTSVLTDTSVTDLSNTLYNTIAGGSLINYNPVIVDSSNTTVPYNESVWYIDNINNLVIFVNTPTLVEPITITFAQYIGNYGIGTVREGPTGPAGPTGLGMTGPTGAQGPPALGSFTNVVFYTTGETNWTVPDNVTLIYVVLLGGGGGGGSVNGTYQGRGGGGSGCLIESYMTVTPGEVISYVVGGGGSTNNGGGDTKFGPMTAGGGGANGGPGGTPSGSYGYAINGFVSQGLGASGLTYPGSSGANSPKGYGQGGLAVIESINCPGPTPGNNAQGYGAGGGGACVNASPGGAANGGSGTGGFIMIYY